MHRRCCWPPDSERPLCLSLSFTSSHSAARVERVLDDVADLRALRAVELRPVGDVVEDRLRERVRLLEHHPDAAPHLGGVDLRAVEVSRRGTSTRPSTLRAGREVVHAVEAPQHRGLAAARRPDERGDLVGGDVEVDLADRGVPAVVDLDVAGARRRARGFSLGLAPRRRTSSGASTVGSGRVDVGRHVDDVSGAAWVIGQWARIRPRGSCRLTAARRRRSRGGPAW